MKYLQDFLAPFLALSGATVCATLLFTRTTPHQQRQALRYAWTAVKMLLAIALTPALVPLFCWAPKAFLPVFTFLWPHLDILGDDGSLYLRRFFMTPKVRWFRPRFLHLIARSDEGRDPHTHPGPFTTTILHGGYREFIYRPGDQAFRDACGLYQTRELRFGMTSFNPAEHTHMVKLFEPTWTWVVGWKRGAAWGFWVLDATDASKDRWILSEEYGAKGEEVESWKEYVR